MGLRRQLVGIVLLGAALAVLSGPAHAQRDEKPFDKNKLSGEESKTFEQLRRGETEYNPGAHKRILEKQARWHVYQLTRVKIQEESATNIFGPTISRVVKKCLEEFPDLRRGAANTSARGERQLIFAQEYAKALAVPIQEILAPNGGRPIAQVNAARILGFLGEVGSEELIDPMVKILNDKEQLDAVKLYVVRGLGELLGSVERYKVPEREVRAVQCLIAFVNRPPASQDADELGAYHYLRQAGLAALAQCRAPALELNRKVVSRPALDQLRFLSGDGVKPAPVLRERLEAAIGVCQVQTKRFEKFYNADYAARHVGYFIADFLTKYMDERNKAPDLKDEPWRLHAARLQVALQAMQTENKKNPYVLEFVSKADSLLKIVERGQPVQVKTFRDWLEQKQPPAKSLYKNDPQAVVAVPSPQA